MNLLIWWDQEFNLDENWLSFCWWSTCGFVLISWFWPIKWMTAHRLIKTNDLFSWWAVLNPIYMRGWWKALSTFYRSWRYHNLSVPQWYNTASVSPQPKKKKTVWVFRQSFLLYWWIFINGSGIEKD
jgi:hypothetical protein